MCNIEMFSKYEFTKKIGSNYSEELVALYNKTNISEKEMLKAVELAGLCENDNVAFVTKAQYENIFKK